MKYFWLIFPWCVVAVLLYIMFSNADQYTEQEKDHLRKQVEYKKSFDSLQARYDLKGLHASRLEAELLTARGEVERSEKELTKAQRNYERFKIEIKGIIEGYNNYQLDSSFRALYPVPDSLRR